MAKQRRKIGKQTKRYQIELTPLTLSLWGFGLLFLLSWVFVLGILVGRGFFPGGVTSLSDLKGQINRLQEMVNRDRFEGVKRQKEANQEPKWAFHEKLTSKKEEVAKESGPEKSSGKARESYMRASKGGGNMSPDSEKSSGRPMPYTIQLASLADRKKAEEMANDLAEKGYPAYFTKVSIKGKTYYRVRCRRFESREEAQRYALKLERDEGLKGYVTRAE